MRLSLEEMMQYVRDDTGMSSDDPKIIRALNSGLDWAAQRLYLTNASTELTFNTTGTLSADTQTLDLGAEIESTGGLFTGLKTFWIQGVNDQNFIPAIWRDANDPQFLSLSFLTPAQVLQPVMYTIYDTDQIRFANELPSGTQWRADWYGEVHKLSLATNTVTSLPEELHLPVTIYGTAQIFQGPLDDTRADSYYKRAERRLIDGIKKVKRKQFGTLPNTQPYPNTQGVGNYLGPNT